MAEESGGDAKRRPLKLFEPGKCEKCRFSEFPDSFSIGYCRRLPPVGVSGSPVSAGEFPMIDRSLRGCGEYAPANPETVEEGAATLARFVLLGDMTAARALADKLVGGD
jgi:hypothetical protein